MTDEPEEIIVEEKQPDEAPKEVTLEEGVDELKQRLAAAEARAKAAEDARAKAESEAHAARGTVQETNLQLVTNAIDTLRQSSEIAKANYKAAMSAGDYDAAATYQEEMAGHAAKLLQLEQGKQALETAPPPRAPAPRPSDPVEAFAQQLSPRSADWVRKHPQFVTDPRLNQKMIAAHNMAMADGHTADSDEYFAYVENMLQVSKLAAPAPRRSTDTAPPAAPVQRETRNSTVVRLTPEEREMAEMMKMSPEEYAKNKLALKKEGRLH
jgi:hypothetical protein